MEAYKSKKTIGAMIHPGFYDKLVLIGFPYDEGAKVSGLRVGAAYGPDCFRRFLHKVGPIKNAEYGVDLSKLTICDYGNINAGTMKDRCEKLTTKVRLTMERGQVTFVMGGTRDLIPYCADAIMIHTPGASLEKIEEVKDKGKTESSEQMPKEPPKLHKILFVGITPGIDTEINAPPNSVKSIWRKLMENPSFIESKSRITLFGSSSLCDKENYDYFTSKGGSVVWLSEIRKTKVEGDPKSSSQTAAGRAFENFLNTHSPNYDYIYISINMESLLASLAPGVTEISGTDGFTGEELAEIANLSGKCKKVRLVDLTEFNPRVEDYRTGRLATSLFYFFSLGLCTRE